MKERKCLGCSKTFPLTSFEAKNSKGVFYRNTCPSCRRVVQNRKKSKTPEAYLKNLYSHLKSSRTKDHPEVVWDIEVEDLVAIWEAQAGRCALTGLIMTYHKDGQGKKDLNVSIDRIDPNIWYIPNNIQLVCSRVNILKHSLSEDLLYWWCKNIVEYKEKE
tara:strand:- start:1330 stop:1812 length:483 start_codon:yes stop_codon:yes gene_type:complete